jgi:hypothetical protein
MSQFRVLSLGGMLGAGLVALVASFIISDGKGSASTLYCVSHPSSSHITTLNTSVPHAKCFRVKDRVFTEIFEEIPTTNDEIKSLDGYVVPGLIDSHGHILQYGEMLESVLLYGAESIAEVSIRVKEFLKKHQGEGYGSREKWIRGIGWDQAYFGGVMPTAVSHSPSSILPQPDICHRKNWGKTQHCRIFTSCLTV